MTAFKAMGVDVLLEVGNGPFLETDRGHRCNTWSHNHGAGAKGCAHGFVLWAHEISLARLRAQRVRQPAVEEVA